MTEPLTPQQENEFLTAICNGENMTSIAPRLGIGIATLFRRLESDKNLDDRYTRAKQAKAQLLAEQIIEIADDSELKPDDKRIRVDARKWVAGKYYGKLFGDKIMTEHSGSIGLTDLSDEELARKLAELEQAKALSER